MTEVKTFRFAGEEKEYEVTVWQYDKTEQYYKDDNFAITIGCEDEMDSLEFDSIEAAKDAILNLKSAIHFVEKKEAEKIDTEQDSDEDEK